MDVGNLGVKVDRPKGLESEDMAPTQLEDSHHESEGDSSIEIGLDDSSQTDASEEDSILTDDDARGYIEQIYLENFMCHRKFKIDLKPYLNVVFGRNGAGKSAILTALMVCLGAKAGDTHRGENLGSLVRSGSDYCIIDVTFRTPTYDVSLMAKYGSRFMLRRRLQLSPVAADSSVRKCTASYHIMEPDEHGRDRGRPVKREDVETILQHFSIFPNNTLAMLTQEDAKNFLVTSKSGSKYELVRRAFHQHLRDTMQAQVDDLIRVEGDEVDMLKQQRIRAQEALAEITRQLDRAIEVESRITQIHQVEALLKWHLVFSEEEMLKKESHKLNELQVNHSSTPRIEDIDASVANLLEKADQAAAEAEAASLCISSARIEVENRTHEFRNADATLASIKGDVLEAESKLKISVDQYAFAKELTGTSERQRREVRKAELSKEIEDIKLLLEQTDSERSELRDVVLPKLHENEAKARRDFDAAVRNETYASRTVAQLEQELGSRHFRQQSGDLSAGFGNEYRRLLDLIERNKKQFHHPPIGPLGRYVKLLSHMGEFEPMIETLLGRHLSAFWVQTDRDMRILRTLAQRAGVNDMRIIVRYDDPFSFESSLPPSNIERYYRFVGEVVEFTKPDIARIFVDLARVESCIIAKDDRIANQEIRARQGKVRSAYFRSMANGQFKRFVGINKRAGGLIESGPVNPARSRGSRMVVDAKIERQNMQTALNAARAEKNDAGDVSKTTETILHSAQSEHKTAKEKMKMLLDEELRQRERLEACETELEDIASVPDTVVGAFPDNLQQAEIALANSRSELANTQVAATEAEAAVHNARVALDEARIAESEAVKERALHQKCEANLREQAGAKEGERARLASTITEQLSAIHEQQQHIEKCEKDLEEHIIKADAMGPRPCHDDAAAGYIPFLLDLSSESLKVRLRDLQSLQAQATVTDAELNALKVARAQREETLLRVDDALKRHKKMHMWSNHNNELRKVRDVRFWHSSKAKIAKVFSQLLSERNFTGGITIDDDTKRLTMEITPEASKNRRANSTLSGGERSFSQIALLMSVWEAMKVGFVAIDEYDVFMDRANRTTSLNLLSSAVARNHLQCILITPQDVDLRPVNAHLRGKINLLPLDSPRSDELDV